MNMLYFSGARYFAEPRETIVARIETDSDRVVGIVTTRPNGSHYSSVLERSDYEIPEWSEARGVLSRSIATDEDEGKNLVVAALLNNGYQVKAHVKPERTLIDALRHEGGEDIDFDPPKVEIKLKPAEFD